MTPWAIKLRILDYIDLIEEKQNKLQYTESLKINSCSLHKFEINTAYNIVNGLINKEDIEKIIINYIKDNAILK